MSKEIFNTIGPYLLLGGLGYIFISRITPKIQNPEDLGKGAKSLIEGTIEGIGQGIETVVDPIVNPLPEEETRKIPLGGLCSENLQCEGAYGPLSLIGCCDGVCEEKNTVAGVPICPNKQYLEQEKEFAKSQRDSLLCGDKLCQEDETCNNGICMPKVSRTIQLCGGVECPSGWNCTTSDDQSLPDELRNTPICVDTATTSLGKLCGSKRCPPGWICENRKCKIP